MNVSEIAFTTYPVKDMDRAVGFYERVIGLTKTMDHRTEGGRWVEFDIGAGTLGLGKMEGWEPSPQGGTAGLEVDDFEQALAEVRAAGVTITMGPIETPVCHMLMIQDTEGNPLILHHRKPGHA
ncbi:VOC family protein [Haloferula sargassicola]|uniref:VOC domain-containing protein n=1 Tax=Haloferula sargassicola TaxID=490096 RepID=A0ABP9UKY8_9BACT